MNTSVVTWLQHMQFTRQDVVWLQLVTWASLPATLSCLSQHLILINKRWKEMYKKQPLLQQYYIFELAKYSWNTLKKHHIKLQSGEKFCGALTFTSAAILSIANPSTVSCKEKWTWANKSKQTLKFISENLNQLFSYPPNRMNVWRHVLMCFCVWGRSSSSFGFYLDEPWYEEAALVAVVKLLPVVLDKLPGGFPAVFTASCHAADYWHGVLRTNLFLSGRRTRERWAEVSTDQNLTGWREICVTEPKSWNSIWIFNKQTETGSDFPLKHN